MGHKKSLVIGISLLAAVALAASFLPHETGEVPVLSLDSQPLALVDEPPEDLADLDTLPVLSEMERISLTYGKGEKAQVYVRPARQEDGALSVSSYALVCELTQSGTGFFLRDVLDLDKSFDCGLVQFELVFYGEKGASPYQYAYARLP